MYLYRYYNLKVRAIISLLGPSLCLRSFHGDEYATLKSENHTQIVRKENEVLGKVNGFAYFRFLSSINFKKEKPREQSLRPRV